ncbi:MAG TPA: hypothetical protein VJV96_03020 [Candidatus Angelobacter sp.]|jgi:hypothetical protein|nr:hypothetical protein [Candidatus Angelobacter sp.]
MKSKIQNFFLAMLLAGGLPMWAQSCQTREEMPEQARTALDNAAKQTFDQAARGDLNSLRTNSIPTLNFDSDVASPVNDNKAALQGATSQIRTSFLLDTGATPSAEGRFYCGVFGANGMASNGAEFDIPNLPAGKYGVVFQDFNGSKGPYVLSTIFQDMGGWKIADFRLHPEAAVGHDGLWYLEQARQFKTKGQNHNAWFYYVTSWDLLAPVPFMESRLLSKILQESGSIQPKDVPTGGKPVSYTANGKTYNITEMSVLRQDNSFDLTLKYSVPSTADFNATQADARNLANALVTQYPELKEVFNRIWAHAVDPSGGDVPGLINLKPSATASATP